MSEKLNYWMWINKDMASHWHAGGPLCDTLKPEKMTLGSEEDAIVSLLYT